MSIRLPKIHLDSGDPEETKRAKGLVGNIDGQTTNPSLIAKNPEIQKYLATGKKLTEKELLDRYKEIIVEIGKLIAGPISIETYADWDSTPAQMLAQAEDMFTWTRNAYVKFPTIPAGLTAANEFVKKGGRVNMTLVFDQKQSAAVYSATLEIKQPAIISPFMGRWDDRGFRGVDLIKNITKQYREFDKLRNVKKSHVEVLAASVRHMEHFYTAIFMGADILTVPYSILKEWVAEEKWIPDEKYRPEITGLNSIIYEDIPFYPDFTKYEVKQEKGTLLDEGLSKFVADWKGMIEK